MREALRAAARRPQRKQTRMCRAEARMRKELADRGVRVSAAWSVREMARELARLETRRDR